MVEMIYSRTRCNPIVLNRGVYEGHEFYIMNLGTHPTAYIECPILGLESEELIMNTLEVHGGVTFFKEGYFQNRSKIYIGWDYAHAWDWVGYMPDVENKRLSNCKHTTQEMTVDAYKAIDQLIQMENSMILPDSD